MWIFRSIWFLTALALATVPLVMLILGVLGIINDLEGLRQQSDLGLTYGENLMAVTILGLIVALFLATKRVLLYEGQSIVIRVDHDIWAAALRLDVSVVKGSGILGASISPSHAINTPGTLASYPAKWEGSEPQHVTVVPGHFFIDLGHHATSGDSQGNMHHSVVLHRSGSANSDAARLGLFIEGVMQQPQDVCLMIHFQSAGVHVSNPIWTCTFNVGSPPGLWHFVEPVHPVLSKKRKAVSSLYSKLRDAKCLSAMSRNT